MLERMAKVLFFLAMSCCFLGVLAVCPACADAPPSAVADPRHKIEFDLTQLDRNGLRGPPDGKTALSYEFAIPNTDAAKAEVKAIDPTIQLMPGSSGRVGAGKQECLCIGTTNQDFRTVLERLAALSYVKRIIECHFE